jgi:hypothetical protein
MKEDIKYNDYKKVLENDIIALNSVVMEAKHFEEFKSKYLDPSKIADEDIIPLIKKDFHNALVKGDFILSFQLNAFLGTIKKKTAKFTKKKKG